jgi:hypothetical protein
VSTRARLGGMVLQSVLVGVLTTACSTDVDEIATPRRESPGAPTSSTPDSTPASPSTPPAETTSATIRIPRHPRELAADLVATEHALYDGIGAWLHGQPGRRLRLLALRHQKIYRLLVRKPPLAERVMGHLRARTARRVRRHVSVAAALRAGVTPVEPPVRLPTTKPSPAPELHRYFEKAGKRFDVPWEVLASINFVETRFGRITGPSSAGALGPMQFLPSSWDRYGGGGDILDPRDSIFAAGRFLRANGAASDLRAALLAYNNSKSYADAVLMYASDMESDESTYYAYYLWHVFVITTRGDEQLTGPGCCNPRDG